MRLAAALALSAIAVLAHAGDVARHGQPMPAGEAVPVSTALADFDAHAGAPRRFSGRITEVCQAMGCWMMLEDNGQAARVMFGKHDFFIDKDTTGTAVVHGVLERKELTPEQVEHFTGDSATGQQAASVEYRIVADGIEITS
ncbi:DUF4920 domain-containing protein [Luteimonas aestuarii]|uniref:DUF4920 domain-containing protein n=1 Tax=Luteimonas aestuarii TaxID=453837 RepID=A0A4R5TNS9_9GAMM|nr:DUF4920 domain-containing protein [Luteimonas aestuarii]TDK24356.1 DUF4920 domain-containing protein [Luteimonas aestuarii]